MAGKKNNKGPKCGRPTRRGTKCQQAAGHKTDHQGEGACWLHGGRNIVKHGLYSKIKRPRLKELLDHVEETSPNIMDLTQEVKLLRGLIADFIERYEENSAALRAWHDSYGPQIETPLHFMRRLMRTGVNTAEQRRQFQAGLEGLQRALERSPTRPGHILDIADAARLVDTLSKVLKRFHDIKQEGFISIASLAQLKDSMAHVVASCVKTGSVEIDQRICKQIEANWRLIQIQGARKT